ncbi:MAG: UTP--glucose-1-phosphate uridylyltransferase [SAR202 cluster bacterium]|nr:UTP--glucose-1-phosphate uridylyltransferase [SAR202 cluster bacterium]|tara:strand:+ start:60435 stop:61250 length:816 start_codon:yes stop_codon:yes gene_type:complete
MSIKTAVIPVAGYGTRFFPASRVIPKALLPIFDTPGIQFVVEEAINSGIQKLIFVISSDQDLIRQYFSESNKIDEVLKKKGMSEKVENFSHSFKNLEIKYVNQEEQNGLGDAILQVKNIVNEDFFTVMLPDDIIFNPKPFLKDMINSFEGSTGCYIALKKVSDQMIPNLGIVDAKRIKSNLYSVNSLIEKPSLEQAPSNLSIMGRYILPNEIFHNLENIDFGANGEKQLTDALNFILPNSNLFGFEFFGNHFDIGTPQGLLDASNYYLLNH